MTAVTPSTAQEAEPRPTGLLLTWAIAHARDSIWAYPWWAYIDGGDIRYLNPHPSFEQNELHPGPWLVGRWFVIAWGYQLLRRQFSAAPTASTPATRQA